MCVSSLFGGAPSIPDPRPPIPAPTRQPKLANEGVRKARDRTIKEGSRLAGTRGGTLLTGASGLTTVANTRKATLLGGTA